ncbi:MAG TPA: AAA family ATPase [Rhizomicrobium sp.]|jgi:chloramphenicol 3-O-phosphotransferase
MAASLGSIVILTGPPGAGKSTVAPMLADTSDVPSVHLHTDNFYTWIRKGYIPPHLPESHAQNQVVIGVIVEAAMGYARGGYDVYLDGIVGPWALEPFHAARDRNGVDMRYIVLRPGEDIALRRAKLRDTPGIKESGPIRNLWQAFADLGPLETHAIDTSGVDAQQTATAIAERLRAGDFRLC